MPGTARPCAPTGRDRFGSGRAAARPRRARREKATRPGCCRRLGPFPAGLPRHPQLSPEQGAPSGALGAGPEAAAPGPTSLVSDLSAQVFWTCRDGFRRRQRETSWNCSLAPSSRALSRPGCSCTKVLISSCPRLGAEHALGICHGVVGNFATVSRTEREEGLPCHSVPCPAPRVKPARQGKQSSLSSCWGPWCHTAPDPMSGLASWPAPEPAAHSLPCPWN